MIKKRTFWRTILFFSGIIFYSFIIIQPSLAITIVSPSPNTKIPAGTEFKVELSISSPSDTILARTSWGTGPQSSKTLKGDSTSFSLESPDSLIDTQILKVLSIDSDLSEIDLDTSAIQIVPGRSLRRLAAFPEHIELNLAQGSKLTIEGTFSSQLTYSDTITRKLTETSLINYKSQDPSIAEVTESGWVQTVSPGRTHIVVEAENHSVEIPVTVTVDDFVYPPLHSSVDDIRSLTFDTSVSFRQPPSDTYTFTQIKLSGGPTTSNPGLASNPTGNNASYQINTNLSSGADQLKVYVWSKHDTGAMMLDVVSDTFVDSAQRLPKGIPDNPLGHKVMNRTAILTEFGKQNGEMIGDLKTTNYVGNSYSYTLVYDLSGKTTQMFKDMGVDVSNGSSDIAYYYADNYIGQWQKLKQADVTVRNNPEKNGMKVYVSGLTRDLPGALGAAHTVTTDDAPGNSGHEEDPLVIGSSDKSSGSSLFKGSESSGGGGEACVIERLGTSSSSLWTLRSLRDWMLQTKIGRHLTQTYYNLSEALLN